MIKEVEKHFILIFVGAIFLGVFIPKIGSIFFPFLTTLLLGILFLNCLKMDIADVMHHVKRPILIAYISFMMLIVIPICFFLLAKMIYPELVIPVMLLAAMPPAMAASALTDLVRGKSSLALVLTIITSLLCPFTIPILIKFLLGTSAQFSAIEMVIMLGKLIFPPFILAMVVRKFGMKVVEKTRRYYGASTVFMIAGIIAGVMGKNSGYILGNPVEVFGQVLFMFFISILLHIVGWYMVGWLDIREKIAVTISVAYVNIAIAVVFAEQFFSSVVVLGLVLYHFPWDIMLVPFRSFIRGSWPIRIRTGMWAFRRRARRMTLALRHQ